MVFRQIFCIFLFASLFSFEPTLAQTDKVLCYYENWAIDVLPPDSIDIDICTHINYSFLGINEDGTLRLDGSEDLLYQLSALKEKNSNVKLIFSVGGWGEDPVGFSHVAADDAKKATMAEDALRLLQTYDFDGFDIDWEYPGRRGGFPEDKQNFVDMLTVLKTKFDENGGYMLTTAVCFDPDCGEYDVGGISKVVDYINVMTYDIHNYMENRTGQNSPLYSSSNDTEWERDHSNCDSSINNWLNRGAAPEKLILGLGFYGKGYQLADPEDHGVGAPTVGEGQGGNYDDICAMNDGWSEVWDEEQEVPFKYSGVQWIGYDNPKSIGLKVQYAKSRNLGGVMMWSVNLDDLDGSCGTKNALLQAIKDNL